MKTHAADRGASYGGGGSLEIGVAKAPKNSQGIIGGLSSMKACVGNVTRNRG